MSKRRSKILETKYFSFFIGLALVLVIYLISSLSILFKGLELKVLDAHLFFNSYFSKTFTQEGVSLEAQNPNQSEDIIILGIDNKTLADFGKYPFARYRYADLMNAFSRIDEQEQRERSILIDVFFVEPDDNATDDALLVEAMEESGRIFMETVNSQYYSQELDEGENWQRLSVLMERNGPAPAIEGPWQDMLDHYGFEAPLQPIGAQVKGFGHANYEKDQDGIHRRQPLISKISRLQEVIALDDLKPGYSVDSASYERLCWMDKVGSYHNISTPLTEKSLASLRKTLEARSPLREEDIDEDGVIDKSYYVVRKFKDHFVPSITLALALDYFNKKFSEIKIVIGDHIAIPTPQKWDPESNSWIPYYRQITQDEYDEEGNLLAAGKRQTIDSIRIPIDGDAQMIVNYLGSRSDPDIDGVQTFPIRSMSTYANATRPPDSELWPPQMGVGNKILLLGAFSNGMAQDEKPTPFGLMYGIEIHANALNTILMGNFVHGVPAWTNFLILLGLVILTCFLSSRMPTIASFFISLGLMLGSFVAWHLLFSSYGLFLDFATPAIAMLLSFIAIIVYRAMTEEKDKAALRETFGKYVSPRVVDQLVQNPPELGGVDRDLTVFFSDIRGFSTFSENMSPQELVNHLNVYLAAMTDLVLEYGGTLDKYIGDAIMAFWGAPLPQEDHAYRACACSLKQMQMLRELNKGWPPERRLNIGIGLNSGIMTVGNMGSKLRMNYTLMGDNVNLGSRLEGTNKEYGTNIIVSEFTYGLVKDKFVFRELDNVRVKGKNKPVGIYELVDFLDEPPSA